MAECVAIYKALCPTKVENSYVRAFHLRSICKGVKYRRWGEEVTLTEENNLMSYVTNSMYGRWAINKVI